jgi:ribonuclease E
VFALKWVKSLTGTAVSAAKHPVSTAGHVAGHAKTVATTGTTVAARLVPHPGKKGEAPSPAAPAEAPEKSPVADEPTRSSAPADEKVEVVEGPVEVTPEVVLKEPAPPQEPPVDIVEQVLAAEDQEPKYGGHATEPKATTRDEEHGEAGLQRAEAEEIAEEIAEAFPAGAVGIETPVGTTGADVGHNPDTAEADLQQPGTEPLVGDATVKAVASELEVAQAAAAVHKAAEKAAAKKTTAKKTPAKKAPAKKAPAKKSSTAKKS